MRLEISHLTSYEYDRPVQLQPHLLYLRPRENPLFEVRNFELRVAPDAKIDWMRDDFDNLPATARFSDLATKLEIGSSCEVTTVDLLPFDFMVRDYAVSFPFEYEPLHLFNLGIYRTPPDAATRSALLLWLAERFPERPKETVSWLFELNQTISQSL